MVESENDSVSSLEGERGSVCEVARDGVGEEGSEAGEGDGDANLQGEGAAGGRGEEVEGAVLRDEDEGEVGLEGGPLGDVHDREGVMMEVVEVGRKSESVRVSVVGEGAVPEEVRKDAWREGEGEEPAAAGRTLVVAGCGERREGEEGGREGGEEEGRSDAVASLRP